jgi:hypothetical protein
VGEASVLLPGVPARAMVFEMFHTFLDIDCQGEAFALLGRVTLPLHLNALPPDKNEKAYV